MQKGPKVSVLVPVFNGEKFLGEALDSVLQQTMLPTEVLVFDNCSTDRSLEIAEQHELPTAVIRNPRNLGAVANFNRSLDAASGDLVLWVASDDRLLPEHIAECVSVLERNPELPACLPGIRFIDVDGAPIREIDDRELASASAQVRLRSFLRRPRWTEFYCMYRRDALRTAPPVSNEYGADVLFTWWFLLRGPIAVASRPLLEYREYPMKSAAEMASALDPQSRIDYWPSARLWKRLWEMSRDPDLDHFTGRIAQTELVLALVSGHWVRRWYDDTRTRLPRSVPILDAVRLLRRRTRMHVRSLNKPR